MRISILLLISLLINGCSSAKTTEEGQTMKDELIPYSYKHGEIKKLCEEAIKSTDEALTDIVKKPETSLIRFEAKMADLSDRAGTLTFMGYVSTDEKIRAEASACEEEMGKFGVSIFTRKDLYKAIKAAKTSGKDEKRLYTETLKKFEKNGLHLPDNELAVVKEKMQRLAVLETQFSANLNNDTSTVEFSAEELVGVPQTFIARQKKTPDDKKFIISTKTPDFKQVSENATNEQTRKQILFAYYNRAADKNMAILNEAIPLRREIAHRLGFKTWADYKTSDRMAKNAANVFSFLNGLRDRLLIKNKADMADLLKYKKKLDPKATEVKVWDLSYLAYQLKKAKYDLDDEKIREYFPAEKVMAGVFDIYSKVLGVQFKEVQGAKVWAPEVKLYEVFDPKLKKIIGHFYGDFYPRPGKYGHYAAFSLILGRQLSDGGYSKPVSALVGNFNPPGNGKPSMLSHDEVETVFHEFGHIMHQTLTKAPYASLSGSEVARDFVETPSQMFEEWAWNPKLITSLSQHYLDPKKKLPATIVKKIVKAKNFNQGYFYTRQLFLALLDMTYHTEEKNLDLMQTYESLYKSLLDIDPLPGTHFPASFGHLMGYDAGYYSYLWAEVYATDLATEFEKQGFLNAKLGQRLRQTVLEKGNMEDGDKLVVEFLQRKHSEKAFFKKLGIK